MTIIPYEERYRDDMIFMVLSAKDALGRIPRLNEDLLDIRKNYLENGTMFWLALDEERVIGCVGYLREDDPAVARLHRLYVKPDRKRQGVGTALLQTAEAHMKAEGFRASVVHLGEPMEQWFESYAFYPKHGYREFAPRWMRKEL